MEKAITKLGDTEIEKQKFCQHKRPISIQNIDINNVVVPSKVSFGKRSFKYFIGHTDAKIRPFCIFIPKMGAYKRDFHENKYMFFLIKDDELLEKYNEI